MVDDVHNDSTVATAGGGEADAAAHDDTHAVVEECEPCTPSAPAGGFAKIVVKRGGVETDIEFPLSPPSIMGRFDPAVGPIDVDLGSLPEGVYVSRKHAKITCEDGVWQIHDLGSSNGTFVLKDDFERVEDSELQDGQEIALGNARLVFHLVPA